MDRRDPDNLDLFGRSPSSDEPAAPLADRLRPRELHEVVGQEVALLADGFLTQAIVADRVPSLVLWGPPGCGKTSLAHVIANATDARFECFSAVLGGIKEVRSLIATAETHGRAGRRTILFVDEIHRFNKAQQDGFLPHVERGTITLIGATTENPSFALNGALLSRCRVVRLEALGHEALEKLIGRALQDRERGLGTLDLTASQGFTRAVAEMADGDARRALNLLEQAAEHALSADLTRLELSTMHAVLERAPLRYDRDGDEHYDTISAFIKSMRGSDPDAALYYAARMIRGGERPLFILRRVLIFASEDVGNADPRALQIALAAYQSFERLGVPEGLLPLAQAITYCASAPKSNASYTAWKAAGEDAERTGSAAIPLHLRNAPTALAKAQGHGQGYQYPHDDPSGVVRAQYLPEALADRRYYRPVGHGYERFIRERLEKWRDDERE